MWADKKVFCTKMLRTKVLLNVLSTLLKFRDREIIVSTFIPSLEKMFIRYFPEVVYEGDTTFFGPPKHHRILRGSIKTVLRSAAPEFFRRVKIMFRNMFSPVVAAALGAPAKLVQPEQKMVPIPVKTDSQLPARRAQ